MTVIKPLPKVKKSTIDKVLSLDRERYEVSVNGSQQHLTPVQWNILTALLDAQGKVISREALAMLVLNKKTAVRAIDTHISRIRKVVGYETIKTVNTRGYRFGL